MYKSRRTVLVALALMLALLSGQHAEAQRIYHKGWIDFNKNGHMDVYEDSRAPIDARVADLLQQMTIEEKTCQLATLYGSGRVLADALPTEGGKNEGWKDGIGAA